MKISNPPPPARPPPLPPAHLRPAWEPAWWVEYHRTLGAGFGAMAQVTIRDKGRFSTLWLTANLPSRQQIGFFRTVLPETEVDRIRSLVRASNYVRHGHKGPMRPDTPITSLRERDDVGTFIPDTTPPQSVLDLFQALDKVAEEIAQNPYGSLAGEAAWKVSEVKRREHVELAVVLRSVGSEEIVIDNPLSSSEPKWVGLELKVSRDKPQAQLDVKQIDLVSQDLLTAEGKLAMDLPRQIALPPGVEFRFLIRRKLLLSEGKYRGSLTFVGGSDDQDGTAVDGSLTMDLGPMTIIK
jgi:hypothetical protein